jgi:hypothetical protein
LQVSRISPDAAPGAPAALLVLVQADQPLAGPEALFHPPAGQRQALLEVGGDLVGHLGANGNGRAWAAGDGVGSWRIVVSRSRRDLVS